MSALEDLKKIVKSVALAAALVPATALAGGDWIDAGASGWNSPGGGIPGSPGANPADLERCAAILRGPETGEDQAVQDMGWALYGAPVGDYGIRVVSAMLGATEDCRPLGFQDFIFVDGAYAGTISPELMDSDTDGARAEMGFASSDVLAASFQRWDGSSSWVSYYIDRAAGPVLVAIPNTPPPVPSAELMPPLAPQDVSLPPASIAAVPDVPASPPTVSLSGTDDRVQPNNRFKIEIDAASSAGIARVSWYMTGTDDADLKAVHERTCEGEQECKETWRVRTFDIAASCSFGQQPWIWRGLPRPK